MSSSNSFENDEITIDFRKISNIVKYRKKAIIVCFLAMIFLAVVLSFILPKKYISEGKILIDKASSTNMADVNPFIISDLGSSAGGVASLMSGSGSLGDEIEILKSPLVLEPVIIENNLKYKSGKKEGMYISSEDFLKDDISIENSKGSNIITISYKSSNPNLSYNVVNSIIENYKRVYEIINSRKALQDTAMLQKAYIDAKAKLNEKVARLKQYNINNDASSNQSLPGVFGLLANYDRRIKNQIETSTQANIESQKLKTEIDQAIAQVNELKQKFEWSNLVQDISKNATNVTILSRPVQKMPFEFSEPKLFLNVALSVVFAFILSIFLLFYLEKSDKKLTFTDIGEKGEIITNAENFNTLNLSAQIFADKTENISLISFVRNPVAEEFSSRLKADSSGFTPNLKQTFSHNSFNESLENIKNSSSVIFLGQIGYTDRKNYNQLKSFTEKAGKQIIGEFAFSKEYISETL